MGQDNAWHKLGHKTLPFKEKTIFFFRRFNCHAPEENSDLEQRG